MEKVGILMTGAGAPGAAGIIRCLSAADWISLHLCDANPNVVGRYLGYGAFSLVPRADDPDFKDAVMQYCVNNRIRVVMPLVTRELFVFAKHKKEFSSVGIQVLVSDERALNIANNKSELYAFLQSKVPHVVPRFFRVNSLHDFEHAVTSLGYPGNPVCFKPSVSNGSRGFRIINSRVDQFDLLFNYKPNNTFIEYQKALAILSQRSFPELLVSEYLPGEEYSVDCLADRGETVIAVPRYRKRMLEGISVEGQIQQSEELAAHSRDIIKAVNLHGNIGIQFKRSEDGSFKLLEINPRVQGTIVAVLGAGVNLPLLAVKQELRMPLLPEELTVRWGTNFIRYWNEVYY